MSSSSPSPPRESRDSQSPGSTASVVRRFWPDFALGALCGLIGILLSAGPHFANWATQGDWAHISDYDELACYLPVIARSFSTHPLRLLDPAAVEEAPNVVYPITQFGPGILIARQLGLGTLGTSFVLRILGGLATGISWYLLLRVLEWPRTLALGCAIFMLSDSGFMKGKPLYVHYSNAASVVLGTEGDLYEKNTLVISHWRIITPSLSWWAVVLHLSAFAYARKRGTNTSAVLCGLTVALLPYIYLYYWIAAGTALLLGLAWDAGHRRLYWIAGVIGFLGAVPYLIEKSRLRAAFPKDWMERVDLFAPSGSMPAIYSRIVLLAMIVMLPVIWKYRREFLYAWLLAFSGILLANHHLVSGITIQNEHWVYVSGCTCATLIVLLSAPRLYEWASHPKARLALGALVLLHLGIAVWFRVMDASRPREAAGIAENYRRYLEQKAAHPGILEAEAGVCGDQTFVDYAVAVDRLRPIDQYSVLFSAATTQDDWNARAALNGIALGQDRTTFEKAERDRLAKSWGPWSANPDLLTECVRHRMMHYDEFSSDPEKAFRSLGVRYVALDVKAKPPAFLNSGWAALQRGPVWNVWENGAR
jgi:hypothetical protein